MNIKAAKLGFVIKEVAIPHLKRAGGLRKSKLVFHPKMHLKIAEVFLNYYKDEKLKAKISELKEKILSEIKRGT